MRAEGQQWWVGTPWGRYGAATGATMVEAAELRLEHLWQCTDGACLISDEDFIDRVVAINATHRRPRWKGHVGTTRLLALASSPPMSWVEVIGWYAVQGSF